MLDPLPQPETSKVHLGLLLGLVTRNLKQGCLLLVVQSLVQTPTGNLLSLRNPNLVARARPVVPHETVITAKLSLLRPRVHAA